MAKKGIIKATPAPQKGADDLAILHPDQTVTIAGCDLTIREYRFVEGLRLQPLYSAFLEDLQQHLGNADSVMLDQLLTLMTAHEQQVTELIAIAADIEPEWIATLGDDEGMQLLVKWWSVNAGFFLRRVGIRRVNNRQQAAQKDAGA